MTSVRRPDPVRRLFVPALLILAAGIAAVWWIARRVDGGLPGSAGPSRPGSDGVVVPLDEPPPEILPPFAVLFAGELGGRFWNPPCSLSRTGGLLRINHGAYQASQGAGAAMLLGTGDICGSAGDAGALEWEVGMTVLRESSLAVDAVGEKDLLLGLDRWRDLKNRHAVGVAVICSNLEDEEGRALVPTYATLDPAKRRVVVAAYLSPSYQLELSAAGVPVRLRPPVEAVKRALEAAGPADFRILLCHGPGDEARRIVAAVGNLDLALAAHDGPLPSPRADERIGGTLFLGAGAGWRHIGRATFGTQAGKTSLLDYAAQPLGRSVRDADFHGMHLAHFERTVEQPGFLEAALAAAAALPGAAAKRHAGPAACAGCHGDIHSEWSREGNPHARTMEAVRKAGFERRMACLPCHATGAGEPGGHAAPGDAQAAVTCEACHGPSEAHALAPGTARTAAPDPFASCARCHVPDMNPGFDPRAMWPKVGHGGPR